MGTPRPGQGYSASLGLTLLPIPLVAIEWVLRLLRVFG
jgi:hypothetical protein